MSRECRGTPPSPVANESDGPFLLFRFIGLIVGLLVAAAFISVASGRSVATLGIVTNVQPAPGANTDWSSVGGALNNQRYSTLNQINPKNVRHLKGVWLTHLGSGLGSKYSQEAAPVVKDGILYITTGADDVFALDAATGHKKWMYHAHLSDDITSACCGWDNRGVALADNKLFLGRIDGKVVALDRATGRELWKTKIVEWHDGYAITAAPTYYDGTVYIGASGGENAARGRLTALDATTGKARWHFFTVPAPNQPGAETWPRDSKAYLHGGGTVWNHPAIDPELKLIYFATGNASPNFNGAVRPGANLYTSSILALRFDGTLAWYYQEVHHDIWDFDASSPVVLFDARVNGEMRKGIAEAGKTGWVYMLDRTNGKPLLAIPERAVPQNANQHTASTQPYPTGDATVPQCTEPVKNFPGSPCIFTPFWHQQVLLSPSFEGGTVYSPMAYSPQTNYFYAPGSYWPFVLMEKSLPYKPGDINDDLAPVPEPLGAKLGGTITAIDASTNKIAWQVKTKYLLGESSGTLATAGGLVFTGQPDGNLIAYNANDGTKLWQWQTGAGVDAPATTYAVNGQQYVAVAAGGNSVTGSHNGDAVWAFKLTNGPAIAQAKVPPGPPTVIGFREDLDPVVKTATVQIQDFSYLTNPGNRDAPSTRNTVKVGTKVTWINLGDQPHTATSDTGAFDTGSILHGHKGTVVFRRPGVYRYHCTPHPWMTGEVVVTSS